jgi:hypothetical protein
MNIIGLGKAGCAISTYLERHPQYTCYKIDTEQKGERCYNFPVYETTEEYETKTPDLKSFFKGMKGDILFVVAGGGAISCSCLNILQQLNSENVTVMYIQPELDMLNSLQASRERLVRGVLQQYARSGLLKRIYLISNEHLENIIGAVPIIGYFDKLNEILSSTLHMINVFKNSEPTIGRIEDPREVCRISTFGIFDPQKNEEKMFFPLDMRRDICYIYGMNKEKLQTDGSLFRKIVTQMKTKVSDTTNISYAIFPTQYEADICYCEAHASYIQP